MENFDLIEQYLLEKMTTDDRVAFEERLTLEADLRKEKDMLTSLILGVESLGLKNKLKGRKIGTESSTKAMNKMSKSKFSFQKLVIAASITTIFFCGWWFMKPDLKGGDQLLGQAFIIDPGLPTVMGETNNYSFYDAMVEYKMEHYEKAIESWSSSSSNIGKDTLDYYIGMALLNQNKYSQALDKLKNVDVKSAFFQKAQWYHLSILIKEKKYNLAKELLNNLPSSIHPKYEEISKYLETK